MTSEPSNMAKDGRLSGIIMELAELPPGAIVDENALALMFSHHVVTVKRAVQRGELPEPVRLFGKPSWTVKAILDHIENRLANARQEAKKEAERLACLSLGYRKRK